MTPAEALHELEALEAELARRSLRRFVEMVWPLVEPRVPFVPNWHIDAISEHLEAVSRGEIAKLLINIPPACMKSYLVSVFWPAWEWATDGGLRVFTASYGSHLSIRDARRVRDIVTSPWYRGHYQVALREDQNQKHRYDTTANGWRVASSVGGVGMGEHPDRIIIDDPHSPQQTDSALEREKAIHWFDRTIATRGISRDVKLVVIMQRLHEHDLTGHILDRGDADDWTHLCLPMRYEAGRQKTTVLGWRDPRKDRGELLWPSMFTADKLVRIERRMDAYARAGQLQQSPVPPGGAMFQREWFHVVGKRPDIVDVRCRFWDCAATEVSAHAPDPDWTVGALVTKVGGTYYIEDIIRVRSSPAAVEALIVRTALADGPAVLIREEEEPGSAGKTVIASRRQRLPGYNYRGVPATGAKRLRWQPLAIQAEVGNVKLVAAGWNREFLEEISAAPRGAHDDQIDAVSGAFSTVALDKTPSLAPGAAYPIFY
jgi:predicted phage terminase large subunit-like protein